MSDALDDLLSAPLDEPADNGFTARIMANVADIRQRRAKVEAILLLVAVALFALVAALTPIGPALSQVADTIVGTPGVWLGAFMLALSSVIYIRVRT